MRSLDRRWFICRALRLRGSLARGCRRTAISLVKRRWWSASRSGLARRPGSKSIRRSLRNSPSSRSAPCRIIGFRWNGFEPGLGKNQGLMGEVGERPYREAAQPACQRRAHASGLFRLLLREDAGGFAHRDQLAIGHFSRRWSHGWLLEYLSSYRRKPVVISAMGPAFRRDGGKRLRLRTRGGGKIPANEKAPKAAYRRVRRRGDPPAREPGAKRGASAGRAHRSCPEAGQRR